LRSYRAASSANPSWTIGVAEQQPVVAMDRLSGDDAAGIAGEQQPA
jgi:hypothetical protein